MSNELKRLAQLFAATSLLSSSMAGKAFGGPISSISPIDGGCLVCEPHTNAHTNGHTDKHTNINMEDPSIDVPAPFNPFNPRDPGLISKFDRPE